MTSERKMAAAALLISVFVAGIVGGAALMALVGDTSGPDRWDGRDRGRMSRMFPPWAEQGDSLPPFKGFSVRHLEEHFARELGLSDEQRGRLTELVETRQERVSGLMKELAAPLRAQLDSMNQEVRGILTPDQQARFDELMEKEEARFRGMSDRFSGGRPPAY